LFQEGLVLFSTKPYLIKYATNRVNRVLSAHLNEALEGLFILVFEGGLDVSQVALGPRDDDPDEGLVVGSGAVHAVVESFGVEGGAVRHALYDGQEAGFSRAGELALDDALEGHAVDVDVLLENLPQVRQTASR